MQNLKLLLPTLLIWSGFAWSQEEIPRPLFANVDFSCQLNPYHSFMRHRYKWKGNDVLSISFTSQKSGVGFLKRDYRQGVGIPLDFKIGKNHSGLSFSIETNNSINHTHKYMFNWYLSRKLSKKLNANVNLYSDKNEHDKSLAYANLNAAFQYQLTAKVGINIGSHAGRTLDSNELVVNHVIGTSYAF